MTTNFELSVGQLVQTGDGTWTVAHVEHEQEFHSREGAWFEAWNLYVVSSGFKDQLTSPGGLIRVLDIGMGLGYNASATIAAWLESDGTRDVEMVSLEIDHRLLHYFVGGDARWCQGWKDHWMAGAKNLKQVDEQLYEATLIHPRSGRKFSWQVYVGDAAHDVRWNKEDRFFHFFWQDPFTPELNPPLWSAQWFHLLKKISLPGAVLMTYSVSRVVKDHLTEGGWSYVRFPTPGRKRHWLRAIRAAF